MTDTIEAVAEAIRKHQAENRVWKMANLAQAAITAHTKALIEGAGEVAAELNALANKYHLNGGCVQTELDRQAAATIAAQKAEIERLTEREAQAKLDGVRAGIEASMQECLHTGRSARRNNAVWCMINIGNLDAEAIAKGIINADALSDLIAGDADLIVPDTLADSDGDDGA